MENIQLQAEAFQAREYAKQADLIIRNMSDANAHIKEAAADKRHGKQHGASRKASVTRYSAASRRRRTAQDLETLVEKVRKVHFPTEERPPRERRLARADFDARVLIKCMNCTQRAGLLRMLQDRIQRQIHYQRTYEEVMRAHRKKVRANRQSMQSKIMAAVTLGSTSGSVKAYTGFRRMERAGSGCPSACPLPSEAAEGAEHVWELCQADLPLYITRDGHGVGLRQALEMEMLNFYQSEPSKPRGQKADGSKGAAPSVPLIDTKTLFQNFGVPNSTGRMMMDEMCCKVTFDGRQCSRNSYQTECMMVLIPKGLDGQMYCQSALRIRTLLVFTGKDSPENVQANMTRVVEEVKHILDHGLRYTASLNTFLGQVDNDGTKAAMQDGDRDIKINLVIPADMSAHFSIFGHGGLRDSNKEFCTHCHCKLSQRQTPFILSKVPDACTVAELAKQHDMKVSTFWLLNAGFDALGMFPPEELTDSALQNMTEPFPTGQPACPAPAAAVVEPDPPAPVGQKRGRSSVNQSDAAFGPQAKRSSGGKKRGGVAEAAKPPQTSQPQTTYFREGFSYQSDEICGALLVPQGTVVRVVASHAMDRKSEFMAGLGLNVDNRR